MRTAPTHESSKFFKMMVFVFFALTDPAESIAKPACMKKTKYAEDNSIMVSMSAVGFGPNTNCISNKKVSG